MKPPTMRPVGGRTAFPRERVRRPDAIERWRDVMGRGTPGGRFIGVSPQEYPRDFGVLR